MKWQDISVDIQTLSSGAVCLCPWAIYMYKIMKFLFIKTDFKEMFLKLVTNDRSNKMFLLASKFLAQDVPVGIKIFTPRGCQPLPRGYIHV